MTRVFYRSIKRNPREPKTTDPFTHEIEIIHIFLFLKTINENSESIPGRVFDDLLFFITKILPFRNNQNSISLENCMISSLSHHP